MSETVTKQAPWAPSIERHAQRVARCDIDALTAGMYNIPAALAQMGYKGMREGQSEPVNMMMAGQDTICVIPTGGGKTAVFVLPTLAMKWRTLVFSPLVALMRDQEQNLQRQGVQAASMNGNKTESENLMAARRWQAGELQVLIVAPERLQNASFLQAVKAVAPDLVVVDEAHVISDWSDGFRGDYCKVGDFITEFNPKVVAAFTATCTARVQADIRRVLGLPQAKFHEHKARRSNLILRTRELGDSDYPVVDALKEVSGSKIVYCSTIKRLEAMTAFLQSTMPGEHIVMFNGQMAQDAKRVAMDAFMSNEASIVVATNAFGMGVDKPDVRAVVHADFPGSLEAIAQEIGRGGRDGKQSICTTFYSKRAHTTQEYFIRMGNPPKETARKLFRRLQECADRQGLVKMTEDSMSQAFTIQPPHVEACMETFDGHRVIERLTPEDKMIKVTIIADDATLPLDSNDAKKYVTCCGKIRELGTQDTRGEWNCDLRLLSARMGLGEPTVRKALNVWHSNGMINFVQPFRGKITKIIGDLSLVDFDRLEEKAAMATTKLEQVLKYLSLPDGAHHAYLESYFEGAENG